MQTLSTHDLEAVDWFRRGEIELESGAQIVEMGGQTSHLYTLYRGYAFRYITLPDGRRQILNLLFPGDFLGLQASLVDSAEHSIEALTTVSLCLFEKARLTELLARAPTLGYDLIWTTANEKRFLDLNLVALGRYRADERIAYFLLYFLERMRALEAVAADGSCEFPLRQQHVADALGMSVPYTNTALQKLKRDGIAEVRGRRLRVLDAERLEARAVVVPVTPSVIPFL